MIDFDKWVKFEEDYCEFGGQVELSYTLSNPNGTVQFNPYSSKLYIWSGLGLGSSHAGTENVDEDNSCYGFSVYVRTYEQLEDLLQALGFKEY